MREPIAERPDMSAYGVPASLDGVLDWAWARQRLISSRNYWASTVSPSGEPSSTPVWGLWSDEDEFWFSCDASSRKRRNIDANPLVTIAADDTVEMVSINGTASVVTSDFGDVIERYVEKYRPMIEGGPSEVIQFEEFARKWPFCIRVIPRRGFGMIERPEEFSTRATRWRWAE